MATTHSGIVLRRLRELVTAKEDRAVPDEQLLDRFLRGHDEAAFAVLVRRHGPLVLGVCRRVLHQEQDAEDVFQATFLVLARKAAAVGRRASLGGWLYRVAYRLALKARKQAAARHQREARPARLDETDPLAELTGRELLAVFDEEVQKLPECERVALVLCYLEGKTRDEAARTVRCSVSTLKRRLDRGKGRLRARLARRGLALPGALLAAGLVQGSPAAVPGPLTAVAVRAGMLLSAGQPAQGVASARAVALAGEAVRAMTVGKVRAVGAVLVALTLVGVGAGWLGWSPPAAQGEAKAPPAAPAALAAAEKQEMTVTGRVLDADGKPFAGADVAVVAEPKVAYRGGDLSAGRPEVLGRGKADAEGRFRLAVQRTSSVRFRSVIAVAGGAGHGLGWHDLDPDAAEPAAEVRLTREQVIRGRFVDVQGQPAAGVTVRVGQVGRRAPGEFKGVRAPRAGKEPPFWPKASVTDKDGRFELRGLGREVLAYLHVRDDRFATQDFGVQTDAKEGEKGFRAALEPAHLIEGTVSYADTGKPVSGARLTVYAARSEIESWFGLDGRADEKGHFRINPSPGNVYHVAAYAPDGEPYLTVRKQVQRPKAMVKQQLELKLPRGVLVRGKVTEAGSGKAVAQATVQFIPRESDNPNFRADVLTGWENTVVSGGAGSFDICVLPGPGHLLIHGPTPDYVFAEVGERKLLAGKEGGRRYYAHAIVPLDLQAGAGPQDVAVTLERAVTVKGRVVGPDGKPVALALMLSRLNIYHPLSLCWQGPPTVVRGGRFELHGCDPDKSYPAYFLDAKNRTGATMELSGKQAGARVTVRLAPCGSATTRLTDADGRPLAGRRVWLEMVVTPGPHRHDRKRYHKGELSADADYVANLDRLNHWDGPLTDAEGRVTFPALIPGATYRIVEQADMDDVVKCEFKAESGKTLKLPAVVRKKRPG
jgi:RNA polymerase sigma factor (sigma-70 family)